jgi:glycine/D-amino acid oxidase-like deaminating enzyme
MPTRYGESPWIAEFPKTRPAFPRLRGEHTCDVVIVGGGLTGCATAYACAMAGLETMLLESERVGQGSSGRSGGLLIADPGPLFRDVVKAHGLRAARRVFESWARGASDGAALLKRLKVPGGVVPLSDLIAGFRGDDKVLAREHADRDGAGIPSRWLVDRQAKTATNLDAAAAIRVPYGFAVDPYRACITLATAASRRGATLVEKSPIRKVKFGRNGVEVTTTDAVVRGGTVIVTTGIATAEFKPLRRHFKRRESYMVMTAPVPAAVRKLLLPGDTTLRDTRSPHHRIRWTADQRLIVSGADQDETPPRTRDAVLVQRTGQLMYELLMMYPAIAGLRPQYGWHLQYGDTTDGLMYIGPHRNYPHHLFALGNGGDSISGAFVAARILARAVRGQVDKADEVFGWTR